MPKEYRLDAREPGTPVWSKGTPTKDLLEAYAQWYEKVSDGYATRLVTIENNAETVRAESVDGAPFPSQR